MSKTGGASRGRTPEVSCIGKEQFETQELATRINRRANRRKVRGRSIYRCHHCRKWHQGTRIGTPRAESRSDRRVSRIERDEEYSNAS